MKILAWYIDLNGIENNNSIKHPYPYGIKKCETLIIDAQMFVFCFFETIPDQHWFEQKETYISRGSNSS